jgi:hypothetical protein
MNYELSTSVGLLAVAMVCERRARYRRDWYAEREETGSPHPIGEQAERRVRRGAGRVRFRRLLALSDRLANTPMPDALRAQILELEETLHAHWQAVASEHFNLGVEAGLLHAATSREAPAELPARDRLRALLAALQRTVDDL